MQKGKGQILFSHVEDKPQYLSFSLGGGKRMKTGNAQTSYLVIPYPEHPTKKGCKARQRIQTSSSSGVSPVKI